jgi:hypothetical protein
MSKKDFIALADLIKARCWNEREGAGLFVRDIADFCEGQNPRFNRQRWLDYLAGKCGPNGGKSYLKLDGKPHSYGEPLK